jgi:hypothetical protein
MQHAPTAIGSQEGLFDPIALGLRHLVNPMFKELSKDSVVGFMMVVFSIRPVVRCFLERIIEITIVIDIIKNCGLMSKTLGLLSYLQTNFWRGLPTKEEFSAERRRVTRSKTRSHVFRQHAKNAIVAQPGDGGFLPLQL